MQTIWRIARNPFILAATALIIVVASIFLYRYVQSLPRAASEDQLYDVSYWKSRIQVSSAAQAYQEAVWSVPKGSPLKVYHEIGHLVGSAIYDVKGLDAIAACDPLTVFGCFHEIVRLYMRDHETKDLRPLAQRCDELLGYQISWMCKHAIGHGLILQNGKTLESLAKSLHQCDSVSTLDFTESCHAGVFMEFDYDMTDPGDLEKARPLTQENIYSPCFDVEGTYFEQCIRRRPYWWVIALNTIPKEERYSHMMQLCRDSRIQGKVRTECMDAVALQMVLYEDKETDFLQRCTEITKNDSEKAICENGVRLAVDMLLPKNRY